MNSWYYMNKNEIDDAGLTAEVQISSWAIVVEITTRVNNNTSKDEAKGWGYIHPAPIVATKTGVAGTHSVDSSCK